MSDCRTNMHKCGMKFRAMPLSGLYGRIFILLPMASRDAQGGFLSPASRLEPARLSARRCKGFGVGLNCHGYHEQVHDSRPEGVDLVRALFMCRESGFWCISVNEVSEDLMKIPVDFRSDGTEESAAPACLHRNFRLNCT